MSRQSAPQHGSSTHRGGAWQRNKATNRAPYDPYDSQAIRAICAACSATPRIVTAAISLKIVEQPVHPQFVRPVSADDVVACLQALAPHHIERLSAVILLGGSLRQINRDWKWGMYDFLTASVVLCALPRKQPVRSAFSSWFASQRFRYPEVRGVTASTPIDAIPLGPLRRFFLPDVLLHEIGHHVSRPRIWQMRGRGQAKLEGFAEAFAMQHASRLADVV